jgi:endo-1,4-beta-xylanase
MKLKSILILAMLMCFAIFTASAQTPTWNQCWIASGGSGVTCNVNQSTGHYTVSWNSSTDWVAGIGWKPCNSQNIQWTGGCTGCNYFGVYGWLSNPITEYYIGRGGGSSAGSYTTSKGSYTLNSYSCNGPNITGNGAFTQFNCSGSGTSPINMAEHFAGWKSLGKTITSQDYCGVCSEAWSGSGSADVTVSAASGTTTSAGSTTTTSAGSTTTTSSAATTTTSSVPPVNGSISIAAGSSAAVGSFVADEYFSGGTTYNNTNTIDVSLITSNPPPAALFNNERYGALSYTIPGFTSGSSYAVTLYFAETYLTASGGRVFNVSINGTAVLSNFDVYASAGAQNKAIAKSFQTTANSSGQIVIQLTSVTENPKINGISIKPGATCPTLGDVDGNGNIDIVDALLIAQNYVGLSTSGFNQCACDANRNGTCDITDALVIAQCYVGLRNCTF